jgi:hypothetical protein
MNTWGTVRRPVVSINCIRAPSSQETSISSYGTFFFCSSLFARTQ